MHKPALWLGFYAGCFIGGITVMMAAAYLRKFLNL